MQLSHFCPGQLTAARTCRAAAPATAAQRQVLHGCQGAQPAAQRQLPHHCQLPLQQARDAGPQRMVRAAGAGAGAEGYEVNNDLPQQQQQHQQQQQQQQPHLQPQQQPQSHLPQQQQHMLDPQQPLLPHQELPLHQQQLQQPQHYMQDHQQQQQHQQQHPQHHQQHQQQHSWQQQQHFPQQQQQQQQQVPQPYPQRHFQGHPQPTLLQQQHHRRRQQQQQQQLQQQQQQRQPSLLLDPQQQRHASVLANAWVESDRRAALAALVKSARDVDSLAAVWLTCRSSSGPSELAVLFNKLAAVAEPRAMSVKGLSTAKVLLRELLIASEEKMSSMAGPEFVYIIASLAKLRASPDVPWVNRWLAMSRHRLGRLNPAQLVMCLRALGRIDVKTTDIQSCIAFPAWIHNLTAALSPRLDELSGFELVKLVLGFSMLGYKPSRRFLNEVAAAVEPKLSSLDTVHLTCLLSSWSALKFEPEAGVMRGVMSEVYAKLPLFDDKDLTAALTAFCSLRRMLRREVVADFVAQVGNKLGTFSPRELAGVLVALGQLGYNPGPEWCAQATSHFKGRLASARNVSTLALVAQGLLLCGYSPEPWLVDELLAASCNKLGKMDLNDLQALTEAVSRFSYRPSPSSSSFSLWQRWFERVCLVVGRTPLSTKQAMAFLQAMCDAGMPPDAKTTDHLVLQMVHGGLTKAPVGRVASLLGVLKMAGQQAGGNFINHYANTLRLVMMQLSADQVASALRCLAEEAFVPQTWWAVCMLAAAHTRCAEFGGPAAAELLWAVAELCAKSRLPSSKWTNDFAGRFWSDIPLVTQQLPPAAAGVAGAAGEAGPAASGHSHSSRGVQLQHKLTARQLGLGLWGAVRVGFKPSEEQWTQWEAAASALDWGLPLDAAQAAVSGYKKAGRVVPRGLSRQLRVAGEAAAAAAHAEVEAAAAARAAAARQLVMQQERMRQAAAAVAAFQQQQQQQLLQQPQQQPVVLSSR